MPDLDFHLERKQKLLWTFKVWVFPWAYVSFVLSGIAGSHRKYMFNLSKKLSPMLSKVILPIYTPHNVQQCSSYSVAPQTLESVSQLNCSHLNGNIMVLVMVLICISVIYIRYVNEVKHLFTYLEAICISSFVKYVWIDCPFKKWTCLKLFIIES